MKECNTKQHTSLGFEITVAPGPGHKLGLQLEVKSGVITKVLPDGSVFKKIPKGLSESQLQILSVNDEPWCADTGFRIFLHFFLTKSIIRFNNFMNFAMSSV